MKILKQFCLAVIFSFGFQSVMAISAYPYPILFTQPNGDTLTLILKGDEFVKYAVTLDGYTLLRDSKGFFVYAQSDHEGELVPSQYPAKSLNQRTNEEKRFLSEISKGLAFSEKQRTDLQSIKSMFAAQQAESKAFPTTGKQRLLCILMEYPDQPFIKTQAQFYNLLNQIGYNAETANGSVRDYFLECSYGLLDLQVDVVGPYKSQYNMVYYGGNGQGGGDNNAAQLAYEAVNFASKDVNFANYDNDGDKIVDAVYMIFAGFGEENGGVCADCIWSHAGNLGSASISFNGVRIGRYACSPELRGSSGTGITRIGVICHEFGHSLGAPDFYDTNYETGGQYDGTGKWELQADGSWNDDGRTPAHPNPLSKIYIYKWATVTVLSTPQTVVVPPSENYSNAFYRIDTKTTNEYFIIENKAKTGFNSYVPGAGMLIYRSTLNPANLGLNSQTNTTHQQKFYPIAANCNYSLPTGTGTYGSINSATCTWPNLDLGKTEFTDETIPSMKGWDGRNTEKPMTNITKHSNGFVTFDFMGGGNSSVSYPVSFPVISGIDVTPEKGSSSPVVAGGDYVFSVSFTEKYENSPLTVRVNGKDTLESVEGTYTITDIQEPKMVEFLDLKIKTFEITATAGENGKISPAGISNVMYLHPIEYSIEPDRGYVVGNVIVDDSIVGAKTSYSFQDVTAPHTISATFVPGRSDIIHVDYSTLNFTTELLEPSSSQVITLEAENDLLTESTIYITTDSPFQISRYEDRDWRNLTTFPKTALPRKFYVRFNPTEYGSFSGEVLLTSAGALTSIHLTGDATTAIDEFSFEKGISLFPNPASEQVTIKISDQFLSSQNTPQVTCTVFNTLGESVSDFNIYNNETILSTAHYTSGIYFVRFLSENRSVVTKLIISK